MTIRACLNFLQKVFFQLLLSSFDTLAHNSFLLVNIITYRLFVFALFTVQKYKFSFNNPHFASSDLSITQQTASISFHKSDEAVF